MSAAAPDLSVVITCFNEGALLLEALESAENNRQGRHEIVLVNGGSTQPDTLAALEKAAGRGHRVISQENLGPSAARNEGIRQARGRYILPLDADNRLRPEYIDRGIAILDSSPSVDVVYGDVEFFGATKGVRRVGKFDFRQMIQCNYIDTCAVYRRTVWERVGGYDEHIPGWGGDDWDFWVRVAASGGSFHHVDEVLFEYRVHASSLTSRQNQRPLEKPWERYMRAKPLPITWGQFSDAVSWNHTVEAFRTAPLRMLGRLVADAYLPRLNRWRQRLLKR